MTAPPPDSASALMHNRTAQDLNHTATIDYRAELIRKSIHLVSLSIPIVYTSITRGFALSILIPLTLAFLAVDLARYRNARIAEWFYSWFGWLLRRHEQDGESRRLSGATNVLLSAVLCVFLFPKIITVNAFAILIISDISAALVGRRWGKHRFMGKSLEGALAFFLSAVLVIMIAPKAGGSIEEYLLWVVAAAFGAVIESSSIKIDDNISIPVGIGLFVWALYALVFPSLPLAAYD